MNLLKPIHKKGKSYSGFKTSQGASRKKMDGNFNIKKQEIDKSNEGKGEGEESTTVKEIKVCQKSNISTLQPPTKVNEFKPYLNHLLAFTPKLRK